MRFDLLIYKDPALLEISARKILADKEARQLLTQQPPVTTDKDDDQENKKEG